MMPNDFQLQTKFFANVPPDQMPDKASIVDWPVSYSDMKPWYLKAEQELGVAGNADEWESIAPRDGAKFPMPAQPKSYSDQVLIKRFKDKGITSTQLDREPVPLEILTMAQARNSEPYDGRPACEGNHNCIPLCPTNAKYDATVHLKRAVRSGAELRTGCVVTQLNAGSGGKIDSVVYKNWKSDNPTRDRTVTAELVILAANPIETPKILFLSNLFQESDPIVGKHLMDHVQYECLGEAPEPLYPYRGPQTISGIDSIRDGRYRSKFASFRITLGNDGWGRHGNPALVLEGLLNPATPAAFMIGKKLRQGAFDGLTRLVRLSISSEQLPQASNKVELSSKKDTLDIPRPKITYEVHSYTLRALEEAFRVTKEIFAAMDTRVKETAFHPENWVTAAHPMGTCRMGTNALDSVVDKFGRCHKHPNLFIVGASVFPTGSATNPVLTIAALTLMGLEEMKKRV